ncbi:MAG: hypothetical protein J7J98_09530 [candidate division Zixibacteria bacterium]|nr:hypothetical protein [candidate division Zixibacteria bacterium]
MRLSIFLVFVCLAIALCSCQSIKIRTGPPTDDEATVQSADRGSQVRSEWADRLRRATLPQQATLLKGFVDSTCARYIRFGYQIADTWRDESDRRGTEIPVADIRQMIDASTRTDLPLFEAYEDVLEYGIDGIREARFFQPRTEDLLIEYRDHYLEIYSAVFYPNGSQEEFESRLRMLRTRSEDLSLKLEEELQRYR